MADKHSLAWIDSTDSPSGEPVTGFEEGGDLGPFNCGNCMHMEDGACTHPVMVRMSKQPKKGDGVEVDEDDCCTYVRRKGETKEENKEK